MTLRKLSLEEAQGLGLEGPSTGRRKLLPEEAAALGLISEISGTTAALRGLRSGASLGFADELGGLVQAAQQTVNSALPGPLRRLAEKYHPLYVPPATETSGRELSAKEVFHAARAGNRADDAQVEAAQPTAFLIGELGGGALVPIPGAGAARGTKLGARLGRAAAQGAGMGAAYGLGHSEADLTRGELGQAALDTGLGAGLGAGAGALAEGVGSVLGSGLRRLRNRANRGSQTAVDAERAAQAALKEKEIRGAVGEYRSAVQSGSRDLEVMAREAAELPPGPLKQSLQRFLNSDEGLAVRSQVAAGKLESAPERVAEIASKADALRRLGQTKDASIDAATGEALRNPLQKHAASRLRTLGYRAMPALAGTAGYAIGGPEGSVLGVGLGTVMSLTQGAPGRILKNLIDKPAVRKAMWDKVLALTGDSPGSAAVISALETAAQRGEQSFIAEVSQLAQRNPEAVEMVMRKVAELGGAQPPGLATVPQ